MSRRGKSVCLVVGGAGFLGSHLVRVLVQRTERTVLVAGRSVTPEFVLPEAAKYIQGDIADRRFLDDVLDQCDEVIDLAYATVPKTSFDDPVRDVLTNLPPTVGLLTAASQRNLKRFLLVSSGGAVYGNAHHLPIVEDHPTDPISPYGITKLATEKYALMFRRVHGLPVIIARPGNPYGPGQLGNRGQGFIGAAMMAVLEKRLVPIFGARGTIRDYIHVDDLVAGLIAVLECGDLGGIYNVGTGCGRDNFQILDALKPLAEQAGYSIKVAICQERGFDVPANILNSERLSIISGWRPQIAFEAGLATTWDWALRTDAGKARS